MSKMNPFEMFLKQVDEATPYLNVEQEFIDILKEPKEVLAVSIPLRLEDGTVRMVKGWRSHHNNALPCRFYNDGLNWDCQSHQRTKDLRSHILLPLPK